MRFERKKQITWYNQERKRARIALSLKRLDSVLSQKRSAAATYSNFEAVRLSSFSINESLGKQFSSVHVQCEWEVCDKNRRDSVVLCNDQHKSEQIV